MNLTWHGPSAFSRGLIGQAFQVDRRALEFSTPYGSLFGLLDAGGSLEFWVKLVGGAAKGPNTLAEVRYGQDPIWTLSPGPNQALQFSGRLGCAATGKTHLTPGAWRHIALVLSPHQIQAYVNGSLDLSLACSNQVVKRPYNPTLIQFGPFPGLLDELAVYDYPLTPATLQQIISQTTTCLTGRQL